MRIAFLCGSQEPGRDGVGDYAAGFAEELRMQGHEVMVVGLRDRFVSETIATGGPGAGHSIRILRLPSVLPWPECIAVARRHLDNFAPEWVSLQFVCYTFHPKGLVHGLAGELAPLLKGRKLHLMFHELWIGDHTGAPLKEAIVGWMQRQLIVRVVHKLRPSAISTSNNTYVAMLKAHGITAFRLPLFGSIPIVGEPDHGWLYAGAEAEGLALTPESRARYWAFGLFAALYRGWPAEPLFTMLREAAEACGKQVIIASVGRIGGDGELLWQGVVRTYGGTFRFMRLGEQPAQRVSSYLQWVDAGIATVPWSLIGKSASVAAMLEHGLPVIANRDNWHWRGGTPVDPEPNPLLHKLDDSLPAKLAGGLPRRPPALLLPKVVRTLIDHLQAIPS